MTLAAANGKTAVVLGARGTLGLALCEQLPLAGWSIAAAVARSECDIRDEAALRALFERTRPTAVFNAAAYTEVDRAELEPEVAFAVNEAGARAVARASAAAGAAVVHYSTDFVFDGEKPLPYDEMDPPTPEGSYARSKVAGDAAVADGWRATSSCGSGASTDEAAETPLDHRAPPEEGRDHPRRLRAARVANLGPRGCPRLGGPGGDRPLRPLPLHLARRDDLG